MKPKLSAGIKPAAGFWIPEYREASGNVADVCDIHPLACTILFVAPGMNVTLPQTSQSPAVKLILVILAAVPVERETADAAAITLLIS
ncbi:MAG: hypothetical protein WC476_12475 [Phycisphaerae bacterium]